MKNLESERKEKVDSEKRNRILKQEGDAALETTYLKHKGVFDITGRDCLNSESSKELIRELDDVIQKHSDKKYHVRLVFLDPKKF